MNDPVTGPVDGSPSSQQPAPEDIANQLRRVLSSPDFAQSNRLKKFLRYVVEETLSGRAKGLKEYTVALEVFERDETFDPQTNSIVRVEASRLRAKLKQYYASVGREDPIQIALPAGSYAPTFGVHTPIEATTPDLAPSRKRSPLSLTKSAAAIVALAILVIGASAVLVFDFLASNAETDQTDAAPSNESYSVAVLPLRNLSGEPDQDYFSDGMTEALIARLAKQGDGRVISTTSVMAFKNVNRPIAEIARALNVSHVLEGSVLLIGDKVRITAQLIDVASGQHLWADSYDRNVVDVLAIQDDVVGRIVASLSGQVTAGVDSDVGSAATINPAAYEAQLRGRFFRNTMTADGFKKGIAYFEEAIEKAPDYALAYSGMASCYCLLSGHGFELLAPSESMPTAKEAVRKAIELDPNLSEPYAFLGITRLKYDWDWPGAEDAFARAIELNPSDAQARIFYSVYFEAMGRQDDAIRVAEEARKIDPLSLAVNVNLGWQYLQAGNLDAANLVFESTHELNPDFWSVHWGFGHYHRHKGDYDQAIESFQQAVGAVGSPTLALSALGYTYAIAGQSEQARSILDELMRMSRDHYVSSFNMAVIHAGLGEPDQAFERLEQAYQDRSRSLVWLNVSKELEPLRSDPRFDDLARRVGLPQSKASDQP